MSSRRAMSSRCFLLALASTPSSDGTGLCKPPRSARASEGPLFFLGSQRSPTFSKLCLSAAYATRCARSSLPYSSAPASCAFAKVRCALAFDRRKVLGSSSVFGLPSFVVFGTAHPLVFRPAAGSAELIRRERGTHPLDQINRRAPLRWHRP